MKRSEMIKKMVEVLEETKNAPLEVQAKSLLAMQTEAGMTAPKHEPFPGSDWAFETREWEDA
jgi:hypothetical protein